MPLLLVALSAALAAPAGHYHPDSVAAGSARFVAAADQLGPAFDRAQQSLTRLGAAAEDLDAAVLLLGDRAPDDLGAWAQQVRKRIAAGYLSTQRHVDLVQQDFSDEFGAALARALEAESADYDLKECGRTGISAMMGGKSDCAGADRNAALAARLDADPALQAFTTELATIPWPTVEVPERTGPPVALTGTARWVAAEALIDRYAEAAVAARAEALEDELDPLLDDIEAGDPAAIAEGQAARDRYAQALAADGAVLWTAMEITLGKAAKKGGPAEVGVCAVPASLGGCMGEDATGAVLQALADDRRFDKAVGRMGQ